MAARLTHSGITPLSERISIFEQKKQTSTTVTTSAASSPMASQSTPGKMQQQQQVTSSVTKKSVTTSRNFSQIMSQFGGNDSARSSSPATPSPPSSLRSSSQSLNLSNSQLFTPTPAARTTVLASSTTKTPLAPVDVNAAPSPRTTLTPLKPVATRAPFSPSVPKSASPTVAPSTHNSFSYSFSVKQDAAVTEESVSNGSKPGRDETDKVNGNFSSSANLPAVDNLNERNKKLDMRRKSSDKVVVVEKPEVEPAAVIVELDNVRSTKNLNLKNQLGSTSTNGQVRGSYWTSQALQNDNAQKISEVIHRTLGVR